MVRTLSLLIHALVTCLRLSYRYRYVGVENLDKARELSRNGNYLLAIWHQNLLHGIVSQVGFPHVVIVSRSRDAEPVAYSCRRLGNTVVRGSSRKGGIDKGGALAKDQMIEILKTGLSGAVTVDGPKGPAKVVKSGIIDMARKSGATLIPYTVRAASYWSVERSWDRFRVPKPFCNIIVHYGACIPIGADTEFEEFSAVKKQLKRSLDDDEKKVDRLFSDFRSLPRENQRGGGRR